MGRLGLCFLSLTLLCLAAAGCAGQHDTVVVIVSPSTSMQDARIDISVKGVQPHHDVDLRLDTTDAAGVRWSSTGRYVAAGRTLSLASSPSRGGSYRGTDAMGLIETLKPTGSSSTSGYRWSGPATYRLSVREDGDTVGRTTFTRKLPDVAGPSTQTVPGQGFDGTFFQPSGTATEPRSAVLAFGGSEGGNGLGLLGRGLAAAGHPTLTLAYFGAPGLPQQLDRIPLEYFAGALRWLARQPGVDPKRVFVLGASRGSEAAQLVAIHFPRLVHGVVLGSPSNVVNQGLVGGLGAAGRASGRSAWTLRGRELPFAEPFADPAPVDASAVIPVEQIPGPVFLVCGVADDVWESCRAAEAIVRRLEAHEVRYQHELERFPDAGHSVGVFLPFQPSPVELTGRLAGVTPWANGQALARVWPALLRFLDAS